jgi:hypothetical protein
MMSRTVRRREGTVATRSIVTLGLVAALSLAACGTDRELTEPDPVPVTTEGLTAALIDVGDLPEGYATVEGDGTPIATEVLPEHDCDDRLEDLDPKESVSRDFTGPDATVTQSVAWFPGQGGAVEQVFRDAANECRQVVVSDQGLSIRAGALDFGVLSDNTLALRFELEPDSGTIQERDVVLMRQGDLVSVIRLSGPRPSDKALLDGAVRVAIGYLGLLHDDTT